VHTTDRGYATNGSTSYLETGFNPTTAAAPNFTQNNAHVGVWNRRATAADSQEMGAFQSSAGVQVMCRDLSSRTWMALNSAGGAATGNGAVADGRGWFAADRSSSANFQTRRNGAATNTVNAASVALKNVSFAIGRLNGLNYWGGVVDVAAVSVGGSLTPAQHVALHAALEAWMTSVGA
jgi:hypothetical protein